MKKLAAALWSVLFALSANAAELYTAPALNNGLSSGAGLTTLFDFVKTQGTLVSWSSYTSGAAVITNPGFPTAGCVYAWTTEGLRITMPAGFAAGQYCSIAVSTGTSQVWKNSEYLYINAEYPGEGETFNAMTVFAIRDEPGHGADTGKSYNHYVTQSSQVYQSSAKAPQAQSYTYRFGLHGGTTFSPWSVGAGTVDGWPNNATITRFEFRFPMHTTGTGVGSTVLLKSIKYGGRNLPFIMVSFDDCKRSQYVGDGGTLVGAREMMAPLGIKGTLYCSSNYVGNANNLTTADIADLKNTYGWDVQIQQTEGTFENIVFPGLPFNYHGTTGLTRVGDTCTAVGNTSVPHNLKTGDTTSIFGAHFSEYNKSNVVITEGANNYTFTFDCAEANAAGRATPASGVVYSWRGRPVGTEAYFKKILDKELAYFTALGYKNLYHIGWSTRLTSSYMRQWVRDLKFATGRGSNNSGANPLFQTVQPIDLPAVGAMAFPHCGMDNTTAANIITCIDLAIRNGSSIALVTHDVVDCVGASGSSTTSCDADLQTVFNYIALLKKQGLADYGTVSEWFARLKQ